MMWCSWVDAQGRVYVADMGNKHIVIFSADGEYLTQFGTPGLSLGELDEPVAMAFDSFGNIYITDTWNQRVQVFISASDGSYLPLDSWDIAGWYGQSLDNKPYLDMSNEGNVFVADPQANRVLQFNTQGDFIQFWGDYSSGPEGFNLVGSVQADDSGGVWVSDTNNNRLMHFSLNKKP